MGIFNMVDNLSWCRGNHQWSHMSANASAVLGNKKEDIKAPQYWYRKTSNISRTLVGNKIVDHSDVVGASPVGDAPTASSFST